VVSSRRRFPAERTRASQTRSAVSRGTIAEFISITAVILFINGHAAEYSRAMEIPSPRVGSEFDTLNSRRRRLHIIRTSLRRRPDSIRRARNAGDYFALSCARNPILRLRPAYPVL